MAYLVELGRTRSATARARTRGAGSGDPPAESRRQDAQLLAVLGHGSTRDAQTLLVQQVRDALVGQWFLLVFLLDEGLDDVLGGAGGNVLAIFGLEPRGEEELELEDSARRLDVLPAAHATHGGLVHVDLA